MTNASDLAADEVRGFSVDLERFSADIADRILEMLLALQEELVTLLLRYDFGQVTLTRAKLARMEKLLQQTRETIATRYGTMRNEVHSDLREVASLSSKNAAAGINTAVNVNIATTGLAPERLRALVDGTLIEGAPSKQWWADQAATTLRNFTNEVQKGYASGEGAAEIGKRITGTKANGYADGVMSISKRNAIALIRSSVQAVSNSARRETFENNDDIIENLQQISTLDGRTCVVGDTLVLTPNGGLVPISDIDVGDKVMGGSLNERLVLSKKKTESIRLVRVTLDNGETITCTPDHLFLTQNGESQEWIEANDLLIGWEIASKLRL